MKKLLAGILFFTFFAIAPTGVAAMAQAQESNAGVYSFDEALELLLEDNLVVRELETAVRNLRIQHTELQNDLRRLESGDTRRELLNQMFSVLHELEMGLFFASDMQSTIAAQTDMATQAMVGAMQGATLGVVGSDEVGFLMHSVAVGNNAQAALQQEMTTIEGHRNMLMEELRLLQDDEFFEEMQDNVRFAVRELGRVLEGLQMQQSIVETSMEHALRTMLSVLAELTSAREMLEADLNHAQANLKRLEISYSLGMLSSRDMRAINHQITSGFVHLDTIDRNINAIMQNLNNMLGLPITQQTVIDFDLTIAEIPEDFDAHVDELVRNAFSVRQAQLTLTSALEARRNYTGNDRDIRITDRERRNAQEAINASTVTDGGEAILELRERIALQDAVENARTAIAQEKRTVENNVRLAFAELDALFQQAEIQERNLADVQDALEVVTVRQAAGHATFFDVYEAELAVARAEQGMESIKNQKWLLSFQLQHTFLL
ncbi:MAG: TolC family protein [Defluviitaleaceae bacterium]|nr:TolC family protein [Defluviitaleaceae bacterium]